MSQRRFNKNISLFLHYYITNTQSVLYNILNIFMVIAIVIVLLYSNYLLFLYF